MDAINNNPISATTSTGLTSASSVTDFDLPYQFGRRPHARAPFPFTERQFARLMSLRGRAQDALSSQDGAAS
jgi:hypothetical protein